MYIMYIKNLTYVIENINYYQRLTWMTSAISIGFPEHSLDV